MFVAGVVALIVGAIDPMEGSVVIASGAILLGFAVNLSGDRHRRIFTLASALIVLGVAAVWVLSFFGGFHPTEEWGWWIAVAPYPVGWLLAMGVLIARAFLQAKRRD
jgi:hypothetical protein